MNYVEENPDFTNENVARFVTENKASGVPEELLTLLVRNEYIHSLPVEQRPIATPEYDEVLQRAIDFIEEGK